MTLLIQVLGALAGGALIAVVLRASGRPLTHAASGVAILATVAACVLFFGHAWRLGHSEVTAANANDAVPKGAAEVAGGSAANTQFLGWARARIIAGHGPRTFWLEPASMRADPFNFQWTTYQLLPARATDLLQEADWIVFYGVVPTHVYYDRAAFRRLLTYTPGFALAERTGVG